MKLADVKEGDVVRKHKILKIYKKSMPYPYVNKKGKTGTYQCSHLLTECCVCGHTKEIRPGGLNTLGCGSSRKCSTRFVDHKGKVFGELTVLEIDNNRTTSRRIYWKCLCSCGKTTTKLPSALTSGQAQRCRACSYILMGNTTRFPEHRAVLNKVMHQTRKRAKNKEMIVELSDNQMIALFKSPCKYCGTPYREVDGVMYRNGIDRVDNDIGYTITNSVACCEICNRMKLALPKEVFLQHVRKICYHSSLLNVSKEMPQQLIAC